MNNSTILQKHNISPMMQEKLKSLQSFKIIFILDDSGSMKTIVKDSILEQTNNSSNKITRWLELQHLISTTIEIASLYNQNGFDVYFLNRPGIKNIQTINELNDLFYEQPSGATPLTKTIQTVLRDNLTNKNLLLLIATDGEPTDQNGTVKIQEFKNCLLNRPKNVFTSIVACTSDKTSVNYLNGLDNQLPRLDVIDDYKNECLEVKKAKGQMFPFSFGDYIVKTLLGSVDPELDSLDEKIKKK